MHWTIVDLPGLVQKEEQEEVLNTLTTPQTKVNGGSHQLNNAEIAEGLVQSYLANERTIVL